jgi:hypothetical protein
MLGFFSVPVKNVIGILVGNFEHLNNINYEHLNNVNSPP